MHDEIKIIINAASSEMRKNCSEIIFFWQHVRKQRPTRIPCQFYKRCMQLWSFTFLAKSDTEVEKWSDLDQNPRWRTPILIFFPRR